MSKHTGKCKWFDRKKGYGFIETEGQADVFVHQTEIQIDGFRALYPDQEVEFTIAESGPNSRPCATNVTGVAGANLGGAPPQGRGRGRGRGRGGRGRGAAGRAAPTEGAPKPRRAPKALLNQAFIFIKPHAHTDAVKALVSDTLRAKNLTILKEGVISAEDIDKKKLIDQHYYAIASKATILQPSQLVVPKDQFMEKFGIDWEEALRTNKVYNAMGATQVLKVDAEKLNEMWGKCKANKKLIKFGGGFYCGEITHNKKTIFVFNGFFMSMRSKFTTPGTSIYYYVVQWPKEVMPWADFRGSLLGPTDPADAPPDSLRGMVMAQWKQLGLPAQPDTGDNAVHASASPFEALAERLNWLEMEAKQDEYGRALYRAGISDETVGDWSLDPRVSLPEGGTGSLFDALEDLDAQECLDKCKALLQAAA